jgi:hypothetical protein
MQSFVKREILCRKIIEEYIRQHYMSNINVVDDAKERLTRTTGGKFLYYVWIPAFAGMTND